MRQLIIARKDLNMSPGKLAAQCCHASMAFITYPMKVQSAILKQNYDGEEWHYDLKLPREIFDEWICGVFTKTICEAKNRNALMKAVTAAKEQWHKALKDVECKFKKVINTKYSVEEGRKADEYLHDAFVALEKVFFGLWV